MADRSHLAIGEVLTLLQSDFPDVTISKIRFLESQGLIDPERTPSGYRKFHDEDIERLRWILTQQRDHFLPLKVIKERLAAGDLSNGPSDGILPFADVAVATSPAVATDAIATTDEPAVPQVAVVDVVADARSAERERARAIAALLEAPAELVAEPVPEPEPEPEPRSAPRGGRRHPTAHSKGDPTPSGDDHEDPSPTLVELDRAAVCERSGLSERELAELERFGLIGATTIGGVESYDEDALAIARLAAGFARYGIEPRHLRMYKVAAEREADMFQQLITPLLRQRRAEARDRAVEMLEELAEMADDLRAIMVQATLRSYLQGS